MSVGCVVSSASPSVVWLPLQRFGRWHLGGGSAAGGVSGPGGRRRHWFGPVGMLLGLRLAGVWLSVIIAVGGAWGSAGRRLWDVGGLSPSVHWQRSWWLGCGGVAPPVCLLDAR
jgi:hypothetical protein